MECRIKRSNENNYANAQHLIAKLENDGGVAQNLFRVWIWLRTGFTDVVVVG